MSDINLTDQEVEDLIIGSSLYSTGGGISFEFQSALFAKSAQEKKTLIRKIDSFNDYEYICTCYIVAKSLTSDFSEIKNLSEYLNIGMSVLSRFCGAKFSALFAGEINIEGLVFLCAEKIGIPVLDADCTGGRAVPEINFDNCWISNSTILPLVAVSLDGDCFILERVNKIEEIDKFVRNLACSSASEGVIVFDHPMTVKEAKRVLSMGTLSRSMTLGAYRRSIFRASGWLDKLIEYMGATKIIEGKVLEVDFTNVDGFLTGTYTIKGCCSDSVKIWVRNENIICWKNDKVVATVPDLIACVDIKTGLGIHNSQLKVNCEVCVIGIPALPMWRGEEALKVFCPQTFGFNFHPVLLQDKSTTLSSMGWGSL